MMLLRRIAAALAFYPTLLWNLLLYRALSGRRWWDRVDEHVLIGALPFSSDVPALQREGVGAVVNTCIEYAGPSKAYARAGIQQLHIPTVDFTPPALEDCERAYAFMRQQIAAGRQVYVHCKAGRGRSATVVVCYLVAAKGLTPEQAQAHLQQCRPHVSTTIHKRVVVHAFAARHGGDTRRPI